MANPVAMINASCDLLEHLKLNTYSNMIREAINITLNDDKIHTLGEIFGGLVLRFKL